jgi:hypothetical protein
MLVRPLYATDTHISTYLAYWLFDNYTQLRVGTQLIPEPMCHRPGQALYTDRPREGCASHASRVRPGCLT